MTALAHGLTVEQSNREENMLTITSSQQSLESSAGDAVQHTPCCIVGGGPGGAVLALLLARQGVAVTLLEAHESFDRDFRGDAMVPAVLDIMDQLGLAERLLQIPHGEFPTLSLRSGNQLVQFVDVRRLHTRFPFLTMLPQARFLQVVVEEAARFSGFRLVMGARVESLVEEDGVIRGVRYRAQSGWHDVRADLVVGADGRFSRIRALASLKPLGSAAPVDLLWLRLPRRPDETPERAGLYAGKGHLVVVLNRGDDWQIGLWIDKGTYPKLRAAGIETLRLSLAEVVPWLGDRVQLLEDWHALTLLSIEASRLARWYRAGLLLIGDAAHVVGPVGGVGIRLAIEDAVAAGNRLGRPLGAGTLTIKDLAAVQRDRELTTRIILGYQAFAQRQLLASRYGIPPLMRVLPRFPLLGRLPARMFGQSLRPVRINTHASPNA